MAPCALSAIVMNMVVSELTPSSCRYQPCPCGHQTYWEEKPKSHDICLLVFQRSVVFLFKSFMSGRDLFCCRRWVGKSRLSSSSLTTAGQKHSVLKLSKRVFSVLVSPAPAPVFPPFFAYGIKNFRPKTVFFRKKLWKFKNNVYLCTRILRHCMRQDSVLSQPDMSSKACPKRWVGK